MLHERIKSSARFFIHEDLKQGILVFVRDPQICRQIRLVLRKKIGDHVLLLNNTQYEYTARICSLHEKEIQMEIVHVQENIRESYIHIHLYQSVLKQKDRFEWCVQKTTEVGVSAIFPIICDYNAFQGKMNEERLQLIAKEASEQSKRSVIPCIHSQQRLKEAFSKAQGTKIVFDETGPLISKFEFKREESETVFSLFIGPEGGWSDYERSFFMQSNVSMASLGKTIVRSETAGLLATFSVLQKMIG